MDLNRQQLQQPEWLSADDASTNATSLYETPEQQQPHTTSARPHSGLRRQPTIYPHGLDISVQTISDEEQLTQNYSRASTLRSSDSNADSDWQANLNQQQQQAQQHCIALTPNTQQTQPQPQPQPQQQQQKYRISLISTPESLAELQVQHFKYPLTGNYYSDAQEAKHSQWHMLQAYAKRHCSWKFMRWPIIFLASVLLFFGLITYCIWLHDVSVAREQYLQRRQQQQQQHQQLLANKNDGEELLRNIAMTGNTIDFADPTTTAPTTTITIATSTASREHATQDAKTILHAIDEPQSLLNNTRMTTTIAKAEKHDKTTAAMQREEVEDEYEEEEGTLEPAHSIRFTSGHQNNFGIPLEEDERILKLLDRLLPSNHHPTAPSTANAQPKTKVSPTIPPIVHATPTAAMSAARTTAQESGCYSTTLHMCRGVLDYDLTYKPTTTLSEDEQIAYNDLINSNCSTRAVEFLCAALEPECRPKHIGILPPCRRICKAVLEACAIVIENSDELSALFDCSLYPDTSDPHKCEDPTRRRGYCFDNEFECYDRSCIPYQWQCDNIKDCAAGEDEESCLECDQEQEFRCRSNEKCIAETARCDLKYDCFDGSDEDDCDDYGSGGDDSDGGSAEFDEAALNAFPRVFSYASILLPNQTNEKLYTYITATADEDNEGRGTQYQVHEITNRTSGISQEEVTNSVPGEVGPNGFVNFRDSKEIMMTSDTENKFKYSRTNRTSSKHTAAANTTPIKPAVAASQRITVTTPAPLARATAPASCAPHELRCISGKCIQVKQLCDKHIDCPDGADELMCVYKERPTAVSFSNSTTATMTTTAPTASTTTAATTPVITTTMRTDKRTIRTTLRRKAKT